METLTVGSLFSGIGGLDLGLERAGMNVIWQSEIDPYACRVLKKHWPDVPNHGDIKQIDWGNIERPNIICGGYPCQPFSTAGKRQGEKDSRHLWPWVRDCISQLRPDYAILENVRGHLSMGGTTVLGDLASIGYDAEWRVVSAASVGANHRRDRVIVIAYPNSGRFEISVERHQPSKQLSCCNGKDWQIDDMAHPTGGNGRTTKPYGLPTVFEQATKLREQGRYGRDISDWWEIEPNVGRVADGISYRMDRLRGLGNAVVPQVAQAIGMLVVQHHQWKRLSLSST